MKKTARMIVVVIATLALCFAAVACGGQDLPTPPVKYTVTYALGGGTGTVPTETDKEAGAKFDLASGDGLTKENHTFDGWSDGTTKYAAGAEYTMPASNVTFTAQWRSDGSDPNPQPPTPTTKYTVTYALGGGTGTVPTETDKEAGAKFDLASGDGLTKENHTFDGWSDGTTKYAAGAEYTMPASNVTFTAQWKAVPTYTVTYRAGVGADGTVPAGGQYEEGDTVTLPQPSGLSKDGYVFVAWKDDESGTTYLVGDTFAMPARSVSLTAQWEVDTSGVDPTVKFTVTVVKSSNDSLTDSVIGDIPTIENKAAGEKFTMPANVFTLPHYSYKWRVQAYNTSENYWETLDNYSADAEITMPAANIRLVAVWTANAVTISFDANGGTGEMASITKNYNTGLALSTAAFDCKFTPPTGKEFQGWSTSANGQILENGTRLDATIVSADDKLTLYAVWTASSEPVLPFTIKDLEGVWTNDDNNKFVVTSDKAGNEFAAGSGILDNVFVNIFIDENMKGVSSYDIDISYGISFSNGVLTLTGDTETITFTSKTQANNADKNTFIGKWTRSSNNVKWLITDDKAYFGGNMTVVNHIIADSYIVMYYEFNGSNYSYVLSKNGNDLTGYYDVAEKAPEATTFVAGAFFVLTVSGKPNQMVNSTIDISKLPTPTAPDGQKFSKWVIAGTQTEFDVTAAMTADASIEPLFVADETSPIKEVTGRLTVGGKTYVKFTINEDATEITAYTDSGESVSVTITQDYSSAAWKDQRYGSDAYYYNVRIGGIIGGYNGGLLIKADRTALWVCDRDDEPIDGGEFTA